MVPLLRFAQGLLMLATAPAPFADHYVLFLGFDRAAEDWDDGRADSLLIVPRVLAPARRSQGTRRARGPSASNLRKTTL
jgi:hypothetical protein